MDQSNLSLHVGSEYGYYYFIEQLFAKKAFYTFDHPCQQTLNLSEVYKVLFEMWIDQKKHAVFQDVPKQLFIQYHGVHNFVFYSFPNNVRHLLFSFLSFLTIAEQ